MDYESELPLWCDVCNVSRVLVIKTKCFCVLNIVKTKCTYYSCQGLTTLIPLILKNSEIKYLAL